MEGGGGRGLSTTERAFDGAVWRVERESVEKQVVFLLLGPRDSIERASGGFAAACSTLSYPRGALV